MTGDRVDAEVARAFWEKKSQEASNRWTAGDMLEYEVEAIGQLLPNPSSILDVGSGHGELSRRLAGEHARLVAVDYAAAYAPSFVGPHQTFVAANLAEFETDERFELVLLLGVVTYLDEADEVPLYRRLAAWAAPDGAVIVKNQCATGESFAKTGFSESLGEEYSGRYPAIGEQQARLAEAFDDVTVHHYPERYNRWPDSAHVAFICRGARA